MGKKICFLSASILILAFDIALTFILDAYGVNITSWDIRILYIVAKCLAVIALAGVVFLYFFKKDTANYAIQYIATVIFQFVPLVIRYLSVFDFGFVVSVVILFVALLLYCCLIFGLWILSCKAAKATRNLEGEKLSPKEEKTAENA